MSDLQNHDDHKPSEIAKLVETAGVSKAHLPAAQMFVLAVLAGAFIGFGAATYTMIMTGVDASFGPARLLGGVGFALGLILVIVGGAELFTGNALMVMAAVDRKIKIRQLLRNWVIVLVGNLVGAAGLAIAFGLSSLLEGPMGTTAVDIAAAKTTLSPLEALVRGALCNALVCLAVWLTFAARSVTGKILSILWPVAGFVLLGLEHSIANLFFFPFGWAAAASATAATASDSLFAVIPLSGVVSNLFWVTLGNILGGAGGVALAYRFAFHGPGRSS